MVQICPTLPSLFTKLVPSILVTRPNPSLQYSPIIYFIPIPQPSSQPLIANLSKPQRINQSTLFHNPSQIRTFPTISPHNQAPHFHHHTQPPDHLVQFTNQCGIALWVHQHRISDPSGNSAIPLNSPPLPPLNHSFHTVITNDFPNMHN